MKNFATLEALRGWMAWWVVVGHALHLMGAGTGAGGVVEVLPAKLLALLTAGDTAVQVFVIVSGFVITHLMLAKQERYPDYLLRRFMRLAPIYLFCLVLALVVQDFYQFAYIDSPLPVQRDMRIARFVEEINNFWPHLMLHLTLLHGVVPDTVLPYASTTFLAPAWSLSLEWQFYLIAPFLIGAVLRGGAMAVLLTIALILAKIFFFWLPGVDWQYKGFFFLAGDLFMVGILSRIAMQRLHDRQILLSIWR